jgi:hypothetical protein
MTIALLSLRRITMALGVAGFAAKLGLFVWVDHTSYWTIGTRTLSDVTVLFGILTMTLALIDFVRSRGDWPPLVAFILGLLAFAPVIGYAS